MKRTIQQIMIYKLDRTGDMVHTSKSSFGTLDAAIANSEMFINRTEGWIDTTVISVKIINKDTKNVLWTYTAPDQEKPLGQILGEKLNIIRQ